MPGMLDSDGTRVLAIHATGDAVVMLGYVHTVKPTILSPADLRDPATLGCLLALVREAWADAGSSVWRDHRTGLWCWMAQGAFHSVHCPGVDGYDTEAESLVAALEAAP
jgi:hypothetical protein